MLYANESALTQTALVYLQLLIGAADLKAVLLFFRPGFLFYFSKKMIHQQKGKVKIYI